MGEKTANIWVTQAMCGHCTIQIFQRKKHGKSKTKLSKSNPNLQFPFWHVKSLEIVTPILKIKKQNKIKLKTNHLHQKLEVIRQTAALKTGDTREYRKPQVFHNFFQKIEAEETLANSIYDGSITLILQSDKHHKKGKLQANIAHE